MKNRIKKSEKKEFFGYRYYEIAIVIAFFILILAFFGALHYYLGKPDLIEEARKVYKGIGIPLLFFLLLMYYIHFKKFYKK